jgi:hypothetical protein
MHTTQVDAVSHTQTPTASCRHRLCVCLCMTPPAHEGFLHSIGMNATQSAVEV